MVAVIAITSMAAVIITATSPLALRNVSDRGTTPNSLAAPNCSACSVVRTPFGVPCEALSSSRNRVKKIGICNRIGRHEENGLVPLSL